MLKRTMLGSLVLTILAMATFGLPALPAKQDDVSDAAAMTSTITYRLAWEWGAARPHATGGWTTTNDLGYTIHISEGYLVSRSVELVPCEQDAAAPVSGLAWLWPTSVYAGHGAGERDESRIAVPVVEALGNPNLTEIAVADVPAGAYCQAHYLIAEGIETAENLPVSGRMLGVSLLIYGTYTSPDGGAAVPFTLSSAMPWGTLDDLSVNVPETLPGMAITGNGDVTITLQRRLDTLFDGVAWESMSEAEQARAVLRNMAEQTQFLITAG